MSNPPSITAKFHPQAWVHDYALDVDAEGPTEWDVTEAVLAMGREKALALADDDYDTDYLRFVPNAPKWIREWNGPFYVEVADSIHEYFKEG